jgi:cysteine desulfurase
METTSTTMTKKVYFDNAATTPMDPEVIKTMTQVMEENYGNPSSIHADGRKARTLIESARKIVAGNLNCSVSEIFFTSCGTESNNTALKCAVRDLGVERIISSRVEHHCILHSLDRLKEEGVQVDYVKIQATGEIDYADLTRLLEEGEHKTMVTLMHANNELGTFNNIARISDLCVANEALFHTDTVQTIGYRKMDLTEIKIHFLTGSAHKFYGPKGAGFLYINGENQIKPFIDGGSQERNMRAGTENIYGIVGLAKAMEIACDNMEDRVAHIKAVNVHARAQLKAAFPDIIFNGPATVEGGLEKVLNVVFPKCSKSDMLMLHMDIAGIAASGGSACSSGSDVGSHVIQEISKASAEPITGKPVRLSFSHKNTIEEVDYLVEKLKAVFGC